MAKLPVYWVPWPGKQTLAATCPADEILYAGTRGGGKSATSIGRHIRGATKYGLDWHGLIARKKYKDLGGLKRGFDELIRKGMPAERIGGENQSNLIRFLSGPAKGAEIILTAFQHVKQLDDWQGFEFTEVTIDEAPQISYIATVIDKMRGTLRSKTGIHTSLFMTGNPGGPGASTLKMLYNLTDQKSWGKLINVEVKFDLGDEVVVENISRIYLHSILEDNKSIDPREYKKKLAAISDKALLEAWLRGDWNQCIGQAFFLDQNRHVIDPIWPIPEHVPMYMTFDWGYGAPFSIGWWWVDSDNRVYRCAEWYGWDGKNPNRGLRMTDREIAEGILAREKAMGFSGRKIERIAGPDSFRRKPNYMGGGQGPSTADEFNDYASSGAAHDLFGNDISLKMRPGDADREKKLRQFRNRMRVPVEPSELPMLVVYNTCTEFIRCIPSIALDEDNIEVIEEGQEDHCLHGDTEVVTEAGIHKIKNLTGTTGFILDHNGDWREYTKCWMTRRNTQTLEVETECGVVTCTPDHRFLTVSGWKEAQDLTSLDLLVRNTSENVIGCAVNTSNVAGSAYTNWSTKTVGEKYRKGGIFTTWTKTGVTILLRILRSFLKVNTHHSTPKNKITAPGLNLCVRERVNGTEVSRELRGTGSSTKSTARVLYKKQGPIIDVYCMHVCDVHSFTLANGLVSSNCYDESCHICMARPIGTDFSEIVRNAEVAGIRAGINKLDSASRSAAQEMFSIKRELAEVEECSDTLISNTPGLDPASVGLLDGDFYNGAAITADMMTLMPMLKKLIR